MASDTLGPCVARSSAAMVCRMEMFLSSIIILDSLCPSVRPSVRKPPKAACQFAADDILLYKFCYYNPMDLLHHLEKGKEELSPLQYHHTMDLLWEKFWWILPLYMKPISFQSKASVVCSVTAAIFIDFCLKKLNVFSQHIGKKTTEYLNSAEQIPKNWNVDQLSVLITSWDIT